jgi:hypothetical protein
MNERRPTFKGRVMPQNPLPPYVLARLRRFPSMCGRDIRVGTVVNIQVDDKILAGMEITSICDGRVTFRRTWGRGGIRGRWWLPDWFVKTSAVTLSEGLKRPRQVRSSGNDQSKPKRSSQGVVAKP